MEEGGWRCVGGSRGTDSEWADKAGAGGFGGVYGGRGGGQREPTGRVEEAERGNSSLCLRGECRAVASLQAPHFCQQWHLYLLNALLMPRHVCCCKLLLRPTLDDEEARGAPPRNLSLSPWVLFNEGGGRRRRQISGTSWSLRGSAFSPSDSFFLFFCLLRLLFHMILIIHIFSFHSCILCLKTAHLAVLILMLRIFFV